MHITKTTPTRESYGELQQAYDFFNAKLFGGKLRACLITLHRHRSAYGYFWAERFDRKDDNGKTKVDEIALNPDTFRGRPDRETLSTLVHEMVHLRQQHHGTPSRNGYHNREWGSMMDAVGLTPTTTGLPGGKRTGQKVTHLIVKGGRFDVACAELLKSGLKITWRAIPVEPKDGKSGKRSKYVCPGCEATVWGKPEMRVHCGDCKGKPQMFDENGDDEDEEGDDE